MTAVIAAVTQYQRWSATERWNRALTISEQVVRGTETPVWTATEQADLRAAARYYRLASESDDKMFVVLWEIAETHERAAREQRVLRSARRTEEAPAEVAPAPEAPADAAPAVETETEPSTQEDEVTAEEIEVSRSQRQQSQADARMAIDGIRRAEYAGADTREQHAWRRAHTLHLAAATCATWRQWLALAAAAGAWGGLALRLECLRDGALGAAAGIHTAADRERYTTWTEDEAANIPTLDVAAAAVLAPAVEVEAVVASGAEHAPEPVATPEVATALAEQTPGVVDVVTDADMDALMAELRPGTVLTAEERDCDGDDVDWLLHRTRERGETQTLALMETMIRNDDLQGNTVGALVTAAILLRRRLSADAPGEKAASGIAGAAIPSTLEMDGVDGAGHTQEDDMTKVETTQTATLVEENVHGVELRHAANRAATWPGYGYGLGRAGYWAGTERGHEYLGRNRAEALRRWAHVYGHGE